jgi:archaellum biogenesis protein FlaJ (TadC family)
MLDLLQNNEVLLWWLLLISAITFTLTLVIVPFILIRIPADYFSHDKKFRSPWSKGHPLIQIPLFIIKNTLGLILIITGIILLALPGQGILTMLAGLVLLDFPGKYQAERWVVELRYIWQSINWIRVKAGEPELIIENDEENK